MQGGPHEILILTWQKRVSRLDTRMQRESVDSTFPGVFYRWQISADKHFTKPAVFSPFAGRESRGCHSFPLPSWLANPDSKARKEPKFPVPGGQRELTRGPSQASAKHRALCLIRSRYAEAT